MAAVPRAVWRCAEGVPVVVAMDNVIECSYYDIIGSHDSDSH